MKKLIAPLLLIVFSLTIVHAQDSVKKVAPKPAAYHIPATPGIHTVNKLVINVRNDYYRDKTPEEVAAIMYASPAAYKSTLDRIYNQYDSKEGVSRDAFNKSVIAHYGDPFPSATPKQVAGVPQTAKPVVPVTDTAKNIATPVNPQDKSLYSQYQYLLTKVYNYQQPIIAAFHKNVMDTLNVTRKNLKAVQDKAAMQVKVIDSLNTVAKSTGETLAESTAKVNAISLLGIEMPKSTYNLIMWGLVIALGVIAGIVIARSGANIHEAKYRTQLYNELDEEYKAYKVKANEKEKKMARELQTERNKLDDLLGKSDS
jgi:hypothetical protein